MDVATMKLFAESLLNSELAMVCRCFPSVYLPYLLVVIIVARIQLFFGVARCFNHKLV